MAIPLCHSCVCRDTDCVFRVSVYGQMCMQLNAKCAHQVQLNVRMCVCLITAGWLGCCIVMNVCLSGSCSDNLFSQVALPHTCTTMHAPTWNIPQLWKSIKSWQLMHVRCRHCCSEITGKVVLMQERTDDALKRDRNMHGFPMPELHFLSFSPLLFVHPDNDCRSGITVISCLGSLEAGWTSATAQETDWLHLHAVHLPAWNTCVCVRGPLLNLFFCKQQAISQRSPPGWENGNANQDGSELYRIKFWHTKNNDQIAGPQWVHVYTMYYSNVHEKIVVNELMFPF